MTYLIIALMTILPISANGDEDSADWYDDTEVVQCHIESTFLG